jgi:hypothetical protein
MKIDGLVKSPSAALRFTIGKGAGGWVLGVGKNFVFDFLLHPTPYTLPPLPVFARLVPPAAGELFTKPSAGLGFNPACSIRDFAFWNRE